MFHPRAFEILNADDRLATGFSEALGDIIAGKDLVADKGLQTLQPALAAELAYSQSEFLRGVPVAVERGMFWLLAILLCSSYQRGTGSIPQITAQDLSSASDGALNQSLLWCRVLKYVQDWHEKGWFTAQVGLEGVLRRAGVMVEAFSRAHLRFAFC